MNGTEKKGNPLSEGMVLKSVEETQVPCFYVGNATVGMEVWLRRVG